MNNNLTGITKAQKLEFLKKVAEKGINFKPFIERIEETFRIQESGLYKSDVTGKIMSLEELRALEYDYMFYLELVDKREFVNKTDLSQGLIPCEIQLAPYTLETYLIYSQRNKENEP